MNPQHLLLGQSNIHLQVSLLRRHIAICSPSKSKVALKQFNKNYAEHAYVRWNMMITEKIKQASLSRLDIYQKKRLSKQYDTFRLQQNKTKKKEIGDGQTHLISARDETSGLAKRLKFQLERKIGNYGIVSNKSILFKVRPRLHVLFTRGYPRVLVRIGMQIVIHSKPEVSSDQPIRMDHAGQCRKKTSGCQFQTIS